jgi:hypothetical protein
MTTETAPAPGGHDQMVRYGIVLAALAHMVLHDRRFHVAVVTGAIGAVALADLLKNNQARPVRRAVHWYGASGASKELARGARRARQELARAGQALEESKRS